MGLVQLDQINMAMLFWYLLKMERASLQGYSTVSVHWTLDGIDFTKYKNNTAMSIYVFGHPVQNQNIFVWSF